MIRQDVKIETSSSRPQQTAAHPYAFAQSEPRLLGFQCNNAETAAKVKKGGNLRQRDNGVMSGRTKGQGRWLADLVLQAKRLDEFSSQ